MTLSLVYKLTHQGSPVPYAYKRSVFSEILHLIRKGICQNIAPNCVLPPVRIALYRLCGFKIGKNCFIGMKCYFDDVCPEKMVIEDNVGISYGVYFSCHGRKQDHHSLVIREGTHIGMRSTILARQDIVIGKNCMIGAMSFVNKSIPDNTTAVGVPAKVIKNVGYLVDPQ